MSVWDSVAESVAEQKRGRIAAGQEERDNYNYQYQRSVAECRPSHARIQGYIDAYLAHGLPTTRGSDIYLVQWSHATSIDLVVEIHKDRSWILWDRDRGELFKYLTSGSIEELEQKGSIADRFSLPPMPGAQFLVAEERISKALYRDLANHGRI